MYMGKRVAVLIAAAGTGSRFGADVPKQFIIIDDRPMLRLTAEVFEFNEFVDDLYVVSSAEYINQSREMLADLSKFRGVCEGGETRQESVRLGLQFIGETKEPSECMKTLSLRPPSRNLYSLPSPLCLIHDAARPFVTDEVIEGVLAGVVSDGAAVCCVPVKDTIYKSDREDHSALWGVPPRDELFSVQTPQGFDLALIAEAHERAFADGVTATDDGSLAKEYGAKVLITEGSYENIKVTTAEDLPKPAGIRVGIGFDVHAFAEGRKLILGGIDIPCERGLLGHSDADVLTHALMDAMLGAIALGDIGMHFPDTDDRYKDISSMKLLEEVTKLVHAKGYTVSNADMTIVAEKPRMSGIIPDIKASIAKALGVGIDYISVKATTTEGLGFTGKEEGIGAQATVALRRI